MVICSNLVGFMFHLSLQWSGRKKLTVSMDFSCFALNFSQEFVKLSVLMLCLN